MQTMQNSRSPLSSPKPGVVRQEIEVFTASIYRLLERQRLFALQLTDKTFAKSIREGQKALYVEKAAILQRLQERGVLL